MKRFIKIFLIILILALLGFGIYYFLNKSDKKTTLSILEKQWIEDNKNTMQDFAIVNEIPTFNYDGEGIIPDFFKEMETTTGLEFNKMTYTNGKNIPSDYAFMITDKKENKDILVNQDNYVLVTKEEKKYINPNEITNMTIGVLKDKMDVTDKYLNINNTLSFTSYNTVKDLIEEFKSEKTELNGIVIPKQMYLNEIISNNFYINYNISEMTLDYVIRLGNNDTLNNIIKKYYRKWSNENFKTLYGKYFTDEYFEFSNINNDSQVKFASKQYKYGFTNLEPYDQLLNNKLLGTNSQLIKEFADVSGIEISYDQYNDISSLLKGFNSNKIDFIFNNNSINNYEIDVNKTISPYGEKIVVLTHIDNDLMINSIKSLDNVDVIDNTMIENYLEQNKINIKQHKNINKLFSSYNKDSVIAIDYETYNIYKHNKLKDYEIKTTFNLNNEYTYLIRDIEANRVFSKYFNFYLSYLDTKKVIDKVDYKDFILEQNNQAFKNILIIISVLLILGVIAFIIKLVKNNKKKVQGISKEDKLRYIDMLTSLKNRNYLNDTIEKWDESEVYPQTIIIVDLNNVAYINDNYGHNEGDNVITEAANILIRNQLEQSEIIRTNGNEFLIYLVGYDEKQIVAYTRKLTKEFKELSHGFGAATGYSMINDGLKTVDDAINEATLDMRANKEETEE